jgi:hypothetical protein
VPTVNVLAITLSVHAGGLKENTVINTVLPESTEVPPAGFCEATLPLFPELALLEVKLTEATKPSS